LLPKEVSCAWNTHTHKKHFQIAIHVLGFLSASDLRACARVSRVWRTISEDHKLWREQCREEGIVSGAFLSLLMCKCVRACRSPTAGDTLWIMSCT
jgi:hypothetical protein